ncbi:hypothetical protein Tco_0435275 [Tanacetum coccineum]
MRLASNFYTTRQWIIYYEKALWNLLDQRDDGVESLKRESSDDEVKFVEFTKRLDLEWNKNVSLCVRQAWLDNGIWIRAITQFKHTCKPFIYKTGCSEWPTYSWRDDGYCNGGNLPGTYIIGNQLHIQDYEWYEALEDYELKNEALRNKAIMEGFIKDDDDESLSEQMKRWNIYANYDDAYEINHEREELCKVRESPVCNVRRYMMIKYSFNNDDEYVTIKEDEYDDLTITRKEACLAYQEIFRIMDEGWMVTRDGVKEELKKSLT